MGLRDFFKKKERNTPPLNSNQATPTPTHPQRETEKENSVNKEKNKSIGATPVGGAFFIPVNSVASVPVGNHIVIDFLGGSSLSHDFTYVQRDLDSCLKRGLFFPEDVLTCNGKQYPLVTGGIDSDRVFVNVNNNQTAIVCFRSIELLLNSPICQGTWISMGTLADVVGTINADYVIIDPGYPSQTPLSMGIVQQVLNAN